MEEIKIKIKELEYDIKLVLHKVDSYSNYGRNPNHQDRIMQLRLLEEYKEFVQKRVMLEEILVEIQQNAL